ncbi:leucyl aminopeptidase [Marinobacter sp. LV10R510-11A]|uniref:M17 family metallopeptidase n=1 Tax=Marinobacter sp. LV10R510-11A TaxID=1415568 RepID=UPI000BB7D7F3|nr:leucyl aminopeptidase family protein [Marinobacter sp. LV10R510-11A]SOB78187.1 leucyl aminopeptidase [Marinobacter sp. LV10R510-11A]
MIKPELPKLPALKLDVDHRIPASWDFDLGVSLILLVPAEKHNALNKSPWADFLKLRLADFPAATNPVLISGPRGTRTAIAFVKDDVSGFKALSQARKLIAPLMEERSKKINVISLLSKADVACVMAEALVSAAYAALFQLPKVSGKATDKPLLAAMNFFGEFEAADFGYAKATAEGNNLARWLTQLPGNYLTPGIYRNFAEALAKVEGWEVEFYDLDELEKLKAGAFLSVVEASPVRDAGILRLRYRPKGSEEQPFALIGKGICFDTGGTNLKVGGSMLGMHGDMQGSAVALGTLLALTRLKFTQPVDCWMALAENHIGPNAVKCNDVVTALNGTTIELINTDAEGRMVLADTLALACREKPRAILDYATLTGAVVSALGQRMAGAITNRRQWVEPIIQAGEHCGERVWPFPYEDDYDEDLKSDVADTLQCRTAGAGDHLYAARFLGKFVDKDVDWVHVDMASSGTHKGGLAHIPTDLQGFGVRFGVEWIRRIAQESR